MVEANVDLENDNPMKTPPFLYGCHYSTPGFVVYYLLSTIPFVQRITWTDFVDRCPRVPILIFRPIASVNDPGQFL